MTRVAAVDVGSNSVRLLVAERGAPLRPLERRMVITRLGAGVDAGGHLDDEALGRTLDCIAGFAQRWRELEAAAVRVTATSAVRDAADRERFFRGVEERTGVRPQVLSGEEEARTAFRGATALLEAPPPRLVLDIGGGSTELILGAQVPTAVTSRQLGCVRLTERCLRSDPPSGAELDAAGAVVDAHLDAAAAEVPVRDARTLIGVAGTVTTIAALHLGLPSYEPERIHGTVVPLAAVQRLAKMLTGMTARERGRLGPMAAGREDVIAGGALILQRAMERFGFDEVMVSEADILDGLVLDLLDSSPE